jgi:hypothetical protein
MSRKVILPQPKDKYTVEDERLRNREIEVNLRAAFQKMAELEERIKALEP